MPGQSPEVHLSGRSKAQRGRGRGFHDSKPHGYVCPLYSCVFIAIPGTTFLVLVLQSFFKVVGKQASFCRGQCLPRVFALSPSNYKVQHYVLSPMAILSSLPFSCHPSRYRTMNQRWRIPVFVLYVPYIAWCHSLSAQTWRAVCLVLCSPSILYQLRLSPHLLYFNVLDTGPRGSRGRRIVLSLGWKGRRKW